MKQWLLLALLLLPFLGVVAQNSNSTRTITGRVLDDQGGSVVGANMVMKGTNTGTVTDSEGNYSLGVSTGNTSATLIISSIGFVTQELAVNNQSQLNITLSTDTKSLSEIVVTGYQTQKKADLTGAVSVVNVRETKDIPVGNPLKALQGRIPGVFITTDGTPNGGATVRIRGIGTLGNNDPLYVIDGVPTKRGLQEINPNDIETMQVLRDASSATIYGSRAANGVIIITTRRAKKGASSINFSTSTSIQTYLTKERMLDATQHGQAYWQAAINDGIDPNTSNPIYKFDYTKTGTTPVLNNVIFPDYIDPQKTMRPANTNWYNEISQPSVIQSYDLSLSTGGERGRSLFALSYYDNKGIIKETFAKRYTARFNAEYEFFKGRLKVGENFTGTFIKSSLIDASGVLFGALVQQPVVPVYTVTGGWGGPAPGMTDRQNPVRLIYDNKQNTSSFFKVLGNAYADLEVIPNMHLRTSYGTDYSTTYARTLRKSYVSGFLSDPSNLVQNNQTYDGSLVWQNTLTYSLSRQKNVFDFLLGHEQIKYNTDNFYASRQGYALETLDYGYLNSGTTNVINGGIGSGYALLSYFGKINYSYNEKYLASVTLRRDGSSRFGRANQFALFPAVSFGWRLSEENFIKKNAPFISDLKFRYGWGRTGNQEIGNYGTFSLYSAIYGTNNTFNTDQGTAYDIAGAGSGQLPSGYAVLQTGNDSLRWETTTQSNIGLDFGLFNNRLTGSIDLFNKLTTDILVVPPRLAIYGGGANPTVNGASLRNRGVEFLLNYEGKIGKKLTFTLTGNIATYQNRVVSLPTNSLNAYPGNGQDKTIVGRPITSYFGYVADGLFRSQAEVDAQQGQVGRGLGRIRYKDLNGDGLINQNDQDYIGNNSPKYTYGLNVSARYGPFDLSFFLQGVQGIDVYNTYKIYTDFTSIWPGTNWGIRTLDAWSPTNSNSTVPALTLVNRNNEGRSSTYFIENGSYLKLRNIQLGYSLNRALTKTPVKSARIYLQGSNLMMIKSKSFTAADPENPTGAYPIPAIYTLGLNVSF